MKTKPPIILPPKLNRAVFNLDPSPLKNASQAGPPRSADRNPKPSEQTRSPSGVDVVQKEGRKTLPAILDVLTVKEAAAVLRVSKSYLDKARVGGTGPPFVRLGAKKIIYRLADLENWLRQNRFQSTSQYPEDK